MNLAKHDPQTELEMNMTPMIDVVFLLIIFFMIISDLTQQDLEELVLPMALYAAPDKPDPDEWRPVLNIPQTGEYIVKKQVYYSPERDDKLPDPYAELKVWLHDVAARMKPEHMNKEEGTGPLIPGEALLIRADETTSFKHIQKVMEFCGLKGIQIWKVQFAASEPPETEDESKE